MVKGSGFLSRFYVELVLEVRPSGVRFCLELNGFPRPYILALSGAFFLNESVDRSMDVLK